MSKLIYCCVQPCFNKQVCDKADDVLKLGWAKVSGVGYSCENHSWDNA